MSLALNNIHSSAYSLLIDVWNCTNKYVLPGYDSKLIKSVLDEWEFHPAEEQKMKNSAQADWLLFFFSHFRSFCLCQI